MSNRVSLPAKYSGETIKEPFDFTSRLAIGETISSATCTCTVFSGVDTSPANVISGAASISGTVVTQTLTGGVTGVIYNIQCSITTSTSQILQLQGLLAILPQTT